MPVTVKDILSLARTESGCTDTEEVCLFGDATRPVRKAMLCWMATSEAIEHAAEDGADLIICHEALFFPYQTGAGPEVLSWPANAHRAQLLARHGITCIRIHQSADALTIRDCLAQRLGLGAPVAGSAGFAVAYDIAPVTYGDLLEKTQAAGFAVLRCTDGDPGRRIERVGMPWGGLGLFLNIPHMEQLVEMGCQAFIAGESDSYGHHFARESGVYMIETGHEVSENPGIEMMACWLKEQFPEMEVSYCETPPAYTIPTRGTA